MRITLSDIYSLSGEQILNDLTIEELTNVVGGYRTRRRSPRRSMETPLPQNMDTQLETWRAELNTMTDNFRQQFGT